MVHSYSSASFPSLVLLFCKLFHPFDKLTISPRLYWSRVQIRGGWIDEKRTSTPTPLLWESIGCHMRTAFSLDDHAACGRPGPGRFAARKRGRTMQMQEVDVVALSTEDLSTNDLTAMLQRRESVPSNGTTEGFTDRSQVCPCQGDRKSVV